MHDGNELKGRRRRSAKSGTSSASGGYQTETGPTAAASGPSAAQAAAKSTGDVPDGHRIPFFIVGVDPGLHITGYAVLSGGEPQLVEAGVIRGGRGALERRLRTLYDGLCELLSQYSPAELAMEELYSHYERPRTAILMGHARGVLCLAASMAEASVFAYSATHVKRMITGSGRSAKAQIQAAVCRELRLTAVPRPPDVADAMAIALCHHVSRNRPVELMIRKGNGGQAAASVAARGSRPATVAPDRGRPGW